MINAFAFLTTAEVQVLAGCKNKSKQIAQLRKMGVPFWINAAGHPVVARSAIEGKPSQAQNDQSTTWIPKVFL